MAAQDHDSSVDPFEDSHVSIDELGTWLKRLRAESPSAPLKELLEDCELGRDILIDLAALDLMLSWRRGHRTPTEAYLEQFPVLAQSESSVLDLIDAEMCIRRELKEVVDVAAFTERFPNFAAPIRQLAYLDGSGVKGQIEQSVPRPVGPSSEPAMGSASVINESDRRPPEKIESSGFELERDLTIAGVGPVTGLSPLSELDQPREDSIDVPIPIRPPEWMIGGKCIASTIGSFGRSWLVKGRDAQRGDFIAMKVIPIPTTLTSLQKTRIMDLCEQVSNVTHPCWVAPRIAAMNRTHLAVVRPWVFGTLLSDLVNERQNAPDERLSISIRLAFTLAAAHRSGATHGAVQISNVIIGHDREVRLLDAASGRDGWQRLLADWDRELSKSFPSRVAFDTHKLMQMMVDELVRSERTRWIDPLCADLETSDIQACAILGERLQAMLDHPPQEKKPWWKRSKGQRDSHQSSGGL
ncbi:hypothetical protein [Rhodopirellula sp. MGV]|uniref:hypothetical protein n=1 Tax=Rhodopirellula sp. MGV TaxID=2023130 RepID=UPI000B95FDAF|nr:hypothetical protein [Rhodopirellula sp. MGV]OYP34894.1 hypothetical protein CGZ80_12725 [Rhodopirellula sp. MGV]PNY38210.1 hypothetical protein C2E31_04225 [Rhodopirellula baltica]